MNTRRQLLGCSLVLLILITAGDACSANDTSLVQTFLESHCVDCHHAGDPAGGLALDDFDLAQLNSHSDRFEKVVRQLSARQMPPLDMPRPREESYNAVIASLAASLDAHYSEQPVPGRTETFRRLNRTEYRNAIRDLLALDVDVATLLPGDEASHGFDNVTVADLSPTLLSRYITAAQKISALAVGSPQRSPGGDTIRLPADLTQEWHVEGLPLGTRGGGLFRYHFPRSGEYQIEIRLTRDRNEEVEGLSEPHDLDVLLDRRLIERFTINPPARRDSHASVDAHLKARLRVDAGTHDLGVTFVKKPTALLETKRQPLSARFNYHRHPRTSPAIYQVSITGPLADEGPGESMSRQRIFTNVPSVRNNAASTSGEDEEARATQILSQLIQRAYRRGVQETDLQRPLELFRQGRAEGDFDAGIELALAAILVNPNFLFRIERDPPDLPSQTAYPLSDTELASRLSFFLWSSIPDDELLGLALRNELNEPKVLEQQVRRMLADERAGTLASNFADQWLYLRNLQSITPDARLYPDFDDNLRQAFRRETQLLFEDIVRSDRSVLDLLHIGETFLNERLAKHYDIPHVYGSQFRKVPLESGSVRGGLLRHGSILTVTSYATRTSPVIRGHWILKNLLGTAPPPPPPDVPALEDNLVAAELSVRERLAAHRANAACASCHDVMDPIGFALENFDAVGRWRDFEFGQPIDASGALPNGSEFSGVAALEQALLQRPDLFVSAMVEKLMIFALGRGVDHHDGPVVRSIVRSARTDDYRFASVILAIVQSPPFQMRTTQ